MTVQHERVREVVDAVLVSAGRRPVAADGALQLDSLLVVELVDALEMRLDVRLRPQDLTAEHFSSLDGLVALVRQRSGLT